MIPYDDLVAALAAWRERQGLPVSTLAPPSRPTPVTAPAPRQPPPAPPAPPRTSAPRAVVDTPSEPLEVADDALVSEDHYDNEGSDFALTFDSTNDSGPTGAAAQRDSFGGRTEPSPPPPGTKRKRNDSW